MKHHPYFKHYIDSLIHIRSWKSEVFGIEKIFYLLIYSIRILFPWFRIAVFVHDHHKRHILMELYICCKLILLFGILYCDISSDWTLYFAVYNIVGVSRNLFSNIYRHHLLLKKNVAHLIINIWEIILWYSVLYHNLHAIGTAWVVTQDWISIIYFSVVTFATVWYWDIGPINNMGKLLVISEIFVSFLFITIVCGNFINELYHSKSSMYHGKNQKSSL